MGAPNITIAFHEQSVATIQRGDKGILAMILHEPSVGEVETKERYSKAASDYMCKDVAIGFDGSVSGTFPYVTDFTGFDSKNKPLQEGHFFGIDFCEKYKDKTIKVKRTSGENGSETSSKDSFWVLRLTDGTDTVFEFRLENEDDPFLTLNFSKATLLKKGDSVADDENLKPAAVSTFTILDATDIPEALSDDAKIQIKKALIGYQNPPKKVIAAVIQSDACYDAALEALGKEDFDYLVAPDAETDEKVDSIVSWIKGQRSENKIYKAVLSGTDAKADNEGIVNLASGYTDADGVYFSPEKACARVAGIICGTPWSASCTYAPLTDAVMCDVLSKSNLDAAVDDGKIVFEWDGEKVKICRGVNSFTTTVDGKGDSFKKIKIVEILDLIQSDIRKTTNDSYIGKYANTYSNKCLLVTAINSYLDDLARSGLLNSASVAIDVDANRSFIKGKGGKFVYDGDTIDLADATDQQVKEAPTGSNVFLRGTISPVDAIEDIELNIYF